MSISRTTEIKSSSPVSFDDAIKKGIARAEKTLKNVRAAGITVCTGGLIGENGKISEYRVQMRITFLLLED